MSIVNLSITPSAPSSLWCSSPAICPMQDDMSSIWSHSWAPHASAMSSAIGFSKDGIAKIPESARECNTLESMPSAQKITSAPLDFTLSIICSILFCSASMNFSYCSGVLISISAATTESSISKGQDSTATFDAPRLFGILSRGSLFSIINPGIRTEVAGVPSPALAIRTRS